MSAEIKFTVSGEAADRLNEIAKSLNVPVSAVVERALANGVFVVEQTELGGGRLIIEDKARVRRAFEPSRAERG